MILDLAFRKTIMIRLLRKSYSYIIHNFSRILSKNITSDDEISAQISYIGHFYFSQQWLRHKMITFQMTSGSATLNTLNSAIPTTIREGEMHLTLKFWQSLQKAVCP